MAKILLPREFHPDFIHPGHRPTGLIKINWDIAPASLVAAIPFTHAQGLSNLADPNMPLTVTVGNLPIQGNVGIVDDSVDLKTTLSQEILGLSGSTRLDVDYTLFTLLDIRKPPVGNNDQFVMMAEHSTTTGDAFLYFDNTGTNGVLATFFDAVNDKITITSAEPDFTAGNVESFASNYRESNTTRRIYLNGGVLAGGQEIGDTRTTESLLEDGTIQFFSSNAAVRRILCDAHLLLLFDQVLPHSEIAELHHDPYRYFEPMFPLTMDTASAAPPALDFVPKLAQRSIRSKGRRL